MLAQVTGLEVGEFVHVIADAHIYERHIPIIERLIEREVHEAPRFALDPTVKDFYDFTENSFTLDGYVFNEFTDRIEVAE